MSINWRANGGALLRALVVTFLFITVILPARAGTSGPSST